MISSLKKEVKNKRERYDEIDTDINLKWKYVRGGEM